MMKAAKIRFKKLGSAAFTRKYRKKYFEKMLSMPEQKSITRNRGILEVEMPPAATADAQACSDDDRSRGNKSGINYALQNCDTFICKQSS
jgi:hypothetical protein